MLLQNETEKRANKQEEHQSDLVIVGGGLSGVCCAIAAARNGIKVSLIQDRPVLGGNASSEIRVWALGATSHMGNNNRWAREGGIIDEIMVENLHRNKEGNPLLFDALLLDKVMSEPNITLYLNTVVYDVEKEGDCVCTITAFNPQNATSYRFTGTYFCDASGDGIVSYMAGASYRAGAEDAAEFGEGFSPSEQYGEFLGHTIFFYPKKTDAPVKYVAPTFALKDMDRIPKLHQATPDQSGCNYWWFEYGGSKDTVYDSEEIKKELWKVIYGVWDHIKNSGRYPEAENMTLEWIGVIPGKRESRRFQGLYMLSQQDIVEQRRFDDAVSYGGWAIDLHPAEGVYSSAPSCNQYHSKGIYSIPYRVFVSKDVKNLFLAGRLISSSHVAFGSTRVMITCAHGGQVVGTAAAKCVKYQCMPADLLQNDRMKDLQYTLNLNGQSIPHVAIDPSGNLLKDAEIKASSSLCFGGFPFDGDWRRLDTSVAQLLPLKGGNCYNMEVEVDADEATKLTVDWVVSSKPFNYTPDCVISSETHELNIGKQRLCVASGEAIPADQYVFVVFRHNEHVCIRLSTRRVTGVLSVFNRFNKAVNNWGIQTPPENSGFESFEFFTPERRPGGENLAFNLSPVVDCFTSENLVNGFVRPYLCANAWIADWDDDAPELKVTFRKTEELHQLRLFFDTDYDHPMETIQWGHPESEIPFCVSGYEVYDDKGMQLASVSGNYQTMNVINFSPVIKTASLRFVFKRKCKHIPVSVFEIEVS